MHTHNNKSLLDCRHRQATRRAACSLILAAYKYKTITLTIKPNAMILKHGAIGAFVQCIQYNKSLL